MPGVSVVLPLDDSAAIRVLRQKGCVLYAPVTRIRYFGFLAPRCRTHDLAQCRQALAVDPSPSPDDAPVASPPRARGRVHAVADRCAWSNG